MSEEKLEAVATEEVVKENVAVPSATEAPKVDANDAYYNHLKMAEEQTKQQKIVDSLEEAIRLEIEASKMIGSQWDKFSSRIKEVKDPVDKKAEIANTVKTIVMGASGSKEELENWLKKDPAVKIDWLKTYLESEKGKKSITSNSFSSEINFATLQNNMQSFIQDMHKDIKNEKLKQNLGV